MIEYLIITILAIAVIALSGIMLYKKLLIRKKINKNMQISLDKKRLACIIEKEDDEDPFMGKYKSFTVEFHTSKERHIASFKCDYEKKAKDQIQDWLEFKKLPDRVVVIDNKRFEKAMKSL